MTAIKLMTLLNQINLKLSFKQNEHVKHGDVMVIANSMLNNVNGSSLSKPKNKKDIFRTP